MALTVSITTLDHTVDAGTAVELTATVTDATSSTWSASTGSFADSTAVDTTWTAPSPDFQTDSVLTLTASDGTDTLTATVTITVRRRTAAVALSDFDDTDLTVVASAVIRVQVDGQYLYANQSTRNDDTGLLLEGTLQLENGPLINALRMGNSPGVLRLHKAPGLSFLDWYQDLPEPPSLYLHLAGEDAVECSLSGAVGSGFMNFLEPAGSSVVSSLVTGTDVIVAVAYETSSQVPDRPQILTVTPEDGQLVLDWDAPDDNDQTITGYTIQIRASSVTSWTAHTTTATEYTITGLTNGMSYYLRLQATNSAGVSEWSRIEIEAPGTRPEAPSAPTLQSEGAQLAVSWSAPESNGRVIHDYDVQYARTDTLAWIEFGHIGPSTSTTITGLVNGVSYTVRVRARNMFGPSAWGVSAAETPYDVPAAPIVSLIQGTGRVTVQWKRPDDGGSPITGYDVQYRADGVTAWTDHTFTGTGTFTRITGLSDGTTYDVRVRAVSAQGNGVWSDVEEQTAQARTTGLTLADFDSTGLTAEVIAVIRLQFNGQYFYASGSPRSADTGELLLGELQLDGTNAPLINAIRLLGSGASARLRFYNNTGTNFQSWLNNLAELPTLYLQKQNEDRVEFAVGLRNRTTLNWVTPAGSTILQNLSDDDDLLLAVAYPAAATVPAAPSRPTLTLGDARIHVSWTAPTDDGGSAVTDYDVQYRLGSVSTWTDWDHTGTETSTTITGLTPNQWYNIRVRAVNTIGDGVWSRENWIRAAGIPTVSGTPTLVAGHQSIQVFAPSNNNQGSRLVSSDIRYAVEDTDIWTELTELPTLTSDTTYTITGLTNGTTYDVQARMRNEIGVSVWSSSATATPQAVPDAPVLTLVPDSEQLSVRWTVPDNNGSELIAYNLQYHAETTSLWSGVSEDGLNTHFLITGLTNGTEYVVRVQATNALGEGTWSEVVSATVNARDADLALADFDETGLTVEALAVIRVEVDGEYLYAKDSSRNDDTGTLLLGELQLEGDDSPLINAIRRTSDTNIRLHHNTEGANYQPWFNALPEAASLYLQVLNQSRIELTVINSGGGYLNASVPQDSTLLANLLTSDDILFAVAYPVQAAVPATPAAPTVTRGNTQLSVSWTAPDDNGSDLTDYDVQYKTSSATAWTDHSFTGTGTSTTITGLTNGTTYNVRVRASNAEGASEWSSSATGTPATTPTVPGAPTVTNQFGELVVSWTAPATGGAAITDYDIQYKTSSATVWTDHSFTGTGTSTTITGLTLGTLYDVRIQATNGVGSSGYSSSTSGTPATVPNQPNPPIVTRGNTQLSVSWAAPANNGSPIIDYDVRYAVVGAETWTTHAFTGTGTSTTITGLTNGQVYNVGIRATNAIGSSSWATSGNVIPATNPAAPTAPTLTTGNSQIQATWTAPDNGGTTITSYTVQYRVTGETSWNTTTTSTTSLTITGLTNGATYQVRIIAVNAVGSSSASPGASATPSSVPDAPLAPTITRGNGQLALSWTAPAAQGSAITDYDVQYKLSTASVWTNHAFTGTDTSTTITGLTNGSAYDVQVRATNANGSGSWSASGVGTPATIPTAPGAPTLTAGNAQLEVSWTAPATGGTAITDYDVQYALAGTASWTELNLVGASTSTTITGLINGTAYDVRIRARNAVGVSPWGTSASATPVTVPAAPIVTLIADDSQIMVRWTAPSTGGSALTSYTIQYRVSTVTAWTAHTFTGTGISTTITGLTNGTEYDVRVRGVNAVGNGAWSDDLSVTVNARMAAIALADFDSTGLTTEVVAVIRVAVDGEYLYAKDSSRNDDTGELLLGELQLDGDDGPLINAIRRTSNTTLRLHHNDTNHSFSDWVTGLQESPTLYLQVPDQTRAEFDTSTSGNGFINFTLSGTSDVLENLTSNDDVLVAVAYPIPVAVPATPVAPTVTRGNGQLALSWTAPSDNGHALTDYDVQYKLSTASAWTDHVFTGTGTSTTITGLTNGSAYDVRIRATNSEGSSEWSPSATGTPATTPTAPAAPTVAVGNGQLQVTWVAPATGGSALTDYDVRYKTSSGTTWTAQAFTGTGTSTTITGLINGTSYDVQIRASNAVGTSGWSSSATGTPQTNPATPSAPTLVRGNTQLEVSWSAPDDQGSTITDYDVQYKTTDVTSWTDHTFSGTGTSTTITGLTNGTAYDVRVRATNSVGSSQWSSAATATPATLPTTPAAPTLTAGNSQLQVSWTAPATGGAQITDYDVQYKTSSDTTWTDHTFTGTGTSTAITGLTNGTAYDVRIRVTNAVGSSAWSASATSTPQAVPATPTVPTVTRGNTQLEVSWTAPDDNGSSITDYDVQYKTSSDTTWTDHTFTGTGTSTTITGLTNGTSYDTRVRATNAVGSSQWSPVAEGTPATVPTAPDPPTLTVGHAQLGVAWTAPVTGGAPITNYDVQYAVAGTSSWTELNLVGSSTSTTITGLTNGTAYDVRVRARNSVGVSAWGTSASATPVTTPAAPTITVTPDSEQLTVRWTAPDAGGSAITGYTIQYQTSDAASWTDHTFSGTGTSTTITGLTNGTEYNVRVRAINTIGNGAWSATATVTVNARSADLALADFDTMGLTTEVVAVIRVGVDGDYLYAKDSSRNDDTGTLLLGELQLDGDQGPLINAIRRTGSGTIRLHHNDDTHSFSAWFTALTESPVLYLQVPNQSRIMFEATTYGGGFINFRVTETSTLLADLDSNEDVLVAIAYTTPAAVPAIPAAPTVTRGNTQLSVSWTAPNNNGHAITDYDIQYKTSSATSWTDHSFTGTGTSTTITGLTNGTAYDVRVRATNAEGSSEWSDASTGTPATVPAAPATPTVTAAHQQLSVTWTAPNANGSPILNYILEYKPSDDTSWTAVTVTLTTTTLTGLTNGTEYDVRVRAVNAVGNSAWSSSVTGTPQSVPATPAAPTVTRGDTELTIIWTAPNDRGSAITDYDIQYKTSSATAWTDHALTGTGTSTTITGLTNGTTYDVRVRAENTVGESAWSASTSLSPGTIPATPAAPTLTAGNGRLSVAWTAPANGGHVLTSYDIQYRAGASAPWQDVAFTGGLLTSTIIVGLTNGRSYDVRVRASNTIGVSEWSAFASASPQAVPSTPDAPTVTRGDTQLLVSWTAPADQGSALTGYDVQYKTSSATTWTDHTFTGTGTSTTITSLTNGTSYDVRVRAVNAVGDGGGLLQPKAHPQQHHLFHSLLQ